MARARLVLSNDTGPRHVAVALERPVVVLMGPTDPRHTAHLLERQRVLREDIPCSACGLKECPIDHRCMTHLLPERAVEAAAELLAQLGPRCGVRALPLAPTCQQICLPDLARPPHSYSSLWVAKRS